MECQQIFVSGNFDGGNRKVVRTIVDKKRNTGKIAFESDKVKVVGAENETALRRANTHTRLLRFDLFHLNEKVVVNIF